MAREVSTNGRKKVSTIMKEFNQNFPYLRLAICPPEMKIKAQNNETITEVSWDKTLSEVRTKRGSGEISLTGSKNVGTIEREFDGIFGLFAQVCYTSAEGKRMYSKDTDNKKSLSEYNREKAAEGCLKDQWK